MQTIVVIFLAIMFLIAIFPTIRRKTDCWKNKASWFQELVTRFQERFPNQPFRIDESDPFTIVVPPKHPTVGDLRICDDASNIMVEVVPFFHEHFFWKDGREGIVGEVLLFAEEIFEDKIEFFAGPRSGGYQGWGEGWRGNSTFYIWPKPVDRGDIYRKSYVWSGPIDEK